MSRGKIPQPLPVAQRLARGGVAGATKPFPVMTALRDGIDSQSTYCILSHRLTYPLEEEYSAHRTNISLLVRVRVVSLGGLSQFQGGCDGLASGDRQVE